MATLSVEVTHRPAVCHHKAIESPLLAENLDQKLVASAAWLAFICIVCTHDLLHICGLDELLECIQICLIEISPRKVLDIEYVSFILRTAMDSEMLQTCVELVVFLISIALETVHHRAAHHCHEVWVLSICLLSTSPSWVAKNVDVRSPYSKSVILDRTLSGTRLVELDALLCGCNFEYILKKVLVPAGSHTDSLWEHCRQTVSGRSVERLVPPVILLDAELRDSRAIVTHKRHFLFEGQSAEQVLCSFLRCEGAVLIRVSFTA